MGVEVLRLRARLSLPRPPFVAVEDALGGYLFFEADDLDAAIELAARIPAARMGGAVEVRPIAEY
jgi:hypothetical protein